MEAARTRSSILAGIPADESRNSGESQVARWCRAAATGDAEAVHALVLTHHRRFVGLVRRKIGVEWQGRIDAEDVLQEAYVDVVRGIGGLAYSDEDSFYRWAGRIIEHKFIDQVRRLRSLKRDASRELRAPAAPSSTYDALLQACQPPGTTASKAAQRADAVGALLACLARLPADYRTAVERVHLHQEPLAAVAAAMDRSPEAVRKLVARGVVRLRECMGRASRFLSSHP